MDHLYKKIIALSFTIITLSLRAQKQANIISEKPAEKVCPLHAMRDEEGSIEQTEALAETTSTPAEQKDDDTESAQRILKYFAQVVAHFFSLLKDPKNPTVVQPHLNGMFSGMISIFMEALKRNHHTSPSYMSEQHAHVAARFNEKIKDIGSHKA